jgi:ribonuclease III
MSSRKKQSKSTDSVTFDGPPCSELAVRFGLNNGQMQLFQEAFTHSSYAHETGSSSNERLEFLGDSILAMITASFLFEMFPEFQEGKLSKLKAIIVSTPTWAEFADELDLPQYLCLGAGEAKTSGRQKRSIRADLFEAFIGAYYLSFGLEATKALLRPLLEKRVQAILPQLQQLDAKTHLQELLQAKGSQALYQTVATEGPPHQRRYTVEISTDNQVIGRGSGSSIKEAQQAAAFTALQQLSEGSSR